MMTLRSEDDRLSRPEISTLYIAMRIQVEHLHIYTTSTNNPDNQKTSGYAVDNSTQQNKQVKKHS